MAKIPLPIDQALIKAKYLAENGNQAQAIEIYKAVLAKNPGYTRAKDFFESLQSSTSENVDLSASIARTFRDIVVAFEKEGRLNDALRLLDSWLSANPTDIDVMIRIGNILLRKGEPRAAVAMYRRSLMHNPESAAGWTGLGNALHDLGRLEEALSAHDAAMDLTNGSNVAIIYNRAGVLRGMGRLEDALEEYRRILRIQPDHHEARYQESVVLLKVGNLKAGWRAYESRWHIPPIYKRTFSVPRWNGEPFTNRTLLLYDEQGFGDAIQFVRFVAAAKARGGQVVLDVRQELVRLFRSVPGADNVIARGQTLPPFDLECPLMSLAGVLDLTLEELSEPVPYLPIPPVPGALRSAMSTIQDQFKVGFVWAGNAAHKNDLNRSTTFKHFLGFLELPGVALVSLQKGAATKDLVALGTTSLVTDLSRSLDDFAETAAAIGQLDMVISVDTSVAHLAGALGVPVWILLPYETEWRWLTDRTDSPWYPTARLFCQYQPGDWTELFARVYNALKKEVLLRATER